MPLLQPSSSLTSTLSYSSLTRPSSPGPIFYALQVPTTNPSTSPTSPLLIFIHPFTNSHEYWFPQFLDPRIGGTYHCVSIDVRGHGYSSTDGAKWDGWQVAEDVLGVAEKVRGELGDEGREVVVVGTSQGGFIGLRAALLDSRSVREKGGKRLVRGVVSCGSSIEEEHKDFVKDYSNLCDAITTMSRDKSPQEAISTISQGMAKDQYGSEDKVKGVESELWTKWGAEVIRRSLTRSCAGAKGGEGEDVKGARELMEWAGEIMKYTEPGAGAGGDAGELKKGRQVPMEEVDLEGEKAARQISANFQALNGRDSLVPHFVPDSKSAAAPVDPSSILIIHGTLDKAYPIERAFPHKMADVVNGSGSFSHGAATGGADGGAGAKVVMLEDAPHFTNVTHWREFGEVVGGWLEEGGRA